MKKYFIRKYIALGCYSDWKEISKKVAKRKAKVVVCYDGCYYHPYEIKVVRVKKTLDKLPKVCYNKYNKERKR